jgi:hypothetical protein
MVKGGGVFPLVPVRVIRTDEERVMESTVKFLNPAHDGTVVPSLHLNGYKEGTTSTPFDRVVMNDPNHFHLVADVIDRLPSLGPRAAYAKRAFPRKTNPGICSHSETALSGVALIHEEVYPSTLICSTSNTISRGVTLSATL